MTRSFLLCAILAASLAAPLFATAAGTDAKWFVLRREGGDGCWTARLISLNGQYASGTALKAGGPFDTEAEAEQRMADLTTAGVCREK